MRKRLKTTSGATAALVALALGGSAIASATQGTPRPAATSMPLRTPCTKSRRPRGPDTDNIQSGDQTSPDTAGAKPSSAVGIRPTPGGAESATETSSERLRSESSSASDGPGGHEDPAGNVDYQSESQE